MTLLKEKVVVADDDASARDVIRTLLVFEGCEVVAAPNGPEAIDAVYEHGPDLVILDAVSPAMTGMDVCQEIRRNPLTRSTPILVLTASPTCADKILVFRSGADDYLVKPFEPVELVTRVQAALERARYMRDVNPLTGIPGNARIQQELERRIDADCPFGLLHVDLDNFKAFNDHYGFGHGDEALKLAGRCCRDAVLDIDGLEGFVGHVGGDDFALIVTDNSTERVAESVIERWERLAPVIYDQADFARGYLEVENRRRELERFPLVTISIGIATNRYRPITSRVAATEIAAEMKEQAKREPRSCFALDRRRDPEPDV